MASSSSSNDNNTVDRENTPFISPQQTNSNPTTSATCSYWNIPIISVVVMMLSLPLFLLTVMRNGDYALSTKGHYNDYDKNHPMVFANFGESLATSVMSTVFMRTNIQKEDNNNVVDDDLMVSVRFYGEAQCPFCRRFVTEVWPTVWLVDDLRKVIDYDFVPWGNSYFATSACGKGPYNPVERSCWYDHCIDNTNDDDCFTGDVVYQHSAMEGQVDIYESCVKDIHGLNVAVNFTYCCEGDNMDDPHIDAKGLLEKCLVCCDTKAIEECADTKGRQIEIANAKKTPRHPGVPYVVVDGNALDDPSHVKEAICQKLAQKGMDPLPPACKCSNDEKEDARMLFALES